ncbi:MAG: hypothetical protein NC299_16635 [Lachnospiraceae bacterium]|nr:hypothetical protein [Lachnospiraceae bacterium]
MILYYSINSRKNQAAFREFKAAETPSEKGDSLGVNALNLMRERELLLIRDSRLSRRAASFPQPKPRAKKGDSLGVNSLDLKRERELLLIRDSRPSAAPPAFRSRNPERKRGIRSGSMFWI